MADDVIDDFKNELVPLSERLNRQGLLQDSLQQLAESLHRKDEALDAIVISGDVTVGNKEDGFSQVSSLLGHLGDKCPPANKIVVVPGNHDVKWGSKPSSLERYENFLKYFRSSTNSFVTPLLDGNDFEGQKFQGDPILNNENPFLLSPHEDWLIVPINSSNYCGVLEPLQNISEEEWESIPDLLRGGGSVKTSQELTRALQRLRMQDVARVSPQQIQGIGKKLRRIEKEIGQRNIASGRLIKIAVLHHQILPVSVNEEFKAYESITNLGLLRNFLKENQFDIVLHGHKHSSKIYWDYLPDSDNRHVSHLPRLLVVSGPSLGCTKQGDDFCRLLKLMPDPFIPKIQCQVLKAVVPGAQLDIENISFQTFDLWDLHGPDLDQSVSRPILIHGRSRDEVYSRLLNEFDEYSGDGRLFNVYCQIDDPENSCLIPKIYPEVNSINERKKQEWFQEMVAWWQKPNTSLQESLTFNHGSRIRNESTGNQLERVINLLIKDTESSRAIIGLFQPNIDNVDNKSHKFPSLGFLQFKVRPGSGTDVYLDCTGYFRAQEILYWWPVNVAEMATLQKEVLNGIKSLVRGDVKLGSLTTISSIATKGQVAPQVLVPAIERALDGNRDQLWLSIYALFHQINQTPNSIWGKWEEYLIDLEPSEEVNPNGVPVAIDGIEFVLKHFERLNSTVDAQAPNRRHLEDIQSSWRSLLNLNRSYAQKIKYGKNSQNEHTAWRQGVLSDLSQIRFSIEAIAGLQLNGNSD